MHPALMDMKQILVIAGILVLAVILSHFARRAIGNYWLHSARKMNVHPSNYRIFKNITSIAIFTLALIAVLHLLPGLEKVGTTLLASAGIISVIIGLAAQQTFGNLISGIFIFIYKPFKVGEYVELNNGKSGVVEDINLRFTIIRNEQNRRMIIPNTLVSNVVIINSDLKSTRVCNFITVSVDYDADIGKAMKVIEKIVVAHADFADNRTSTMIEEGISIVPVRVTSLENFAVALSVEAWCRADEPSYPMKCDILLAIKNSFDKAEIRMASPVRKILFEEKEKADAVLKKEVAMPGIKR
jgi:small-conductance mechanosensitive channel